MNKMYELGCDGCAAEFTDEPTSLNAFLERCPFDGTNVQRQKRWQRVLTRGGNCALTQTVQLDASPGQQNTAESIQKSE